MKIKKIFIAFISSVLFFIILAGPALAGQVYVSDDYLELEAGEEPTYILLTFDEAAGHFSVSSSGSVHANEDDFLDNDSYAIGISATGTGYGTVTISLDDVATYDDKDLSGTTIEIEVNVYEPENGDTDYGKGQDENAPTDETTDKSEDENTAEKSAKRKVTVDNKEYTVLADLNGLDCPKGFTETEETLEGEKVKVLKYKDSLKLYALKNTSDKTVLFYTYNEDTKKFEKPLSISQGKRTYYILSLPSEMSVEGYQKKETTVNGEQMQAYVSNYSGMEDYCYIYAMNDGEENFYSYDSKENTIQRVSEFMIPMDDHMKMLEEKKVALLDNKYVLIGGAVVFALLIFFLIMWLVTNKKYKETLEDLNDAEYLQFQDSSHENEENMDVDFDAPIDYEDTVIFKNQTYDDDMDDIFFDDLK